jgi:DNA-directed RNA polymerase specialized sigma subunit
MATAHRAEPDDAERDAMGEVDRAVAALPPRLQQILEMYYGGELSLRGIGSVLGITESRVSQLHAQALERLRATAAGAPSVSRARAPARSERHERRRRSRTSEGS